MSFAPALWSVKARAARGSRCAQDLFRFVPLVDRIRRYPVTYGTGSGGLESAKRRRRKPDRVGNMTSRFSEALEFQIGTQGGPCPEAGEKPTINETD
ncbi:MAG TPA: hypothetical protein VNE82_08535 [Candidatus Binataceae bacterium]|nr:hypothetical protein [Candidatus Binataceae bacterium]